jgi:hypothetical protein
MRIKSIMMVIALSSYFLMYPAAQSVITNIPEKKYINFLELNNLFEDFFKENSVLKNLFDDGRLKNKDFAQRVKDLKSEEFLSEDSLLYQSIMGEQSLVFFSGASDAQRKGLYKLIGNLLDRYIVQGQQFFEFLSKGIGVNYPLSWCCCRYAPIEERFVLILHSVLDAYFRIKKDRVITYGSLASGDLLQDYLHITTLMDLGFKKFNMHLFDTAYPDKRELATNEKEKNKRLLGLNGSESAAKIDTKNERMAVRFALFEKLLKESLINHRFDTSESLITIQYWPQEFTSEFDYPKGKEVLSR